MMSRHSFRISSIHNRRGWTRPIIPVRKSTNPKAKKWWQKEIYSKLLFALVGAGLALVGSYVMHLVSTKASYKQLAYQNGHFHVQQSLHLLYEGNDSVDTGLIIGGYSFVGSQVFSQWDIINTSDKQVVENTVKTLSIIEEGLRRSPGNLYLYWLRGLARFKMGQYDWAILDFRHVFEKWPHFIKAGLAMVTAYCKLGQHKLARKLIETMHKRDLVTDATYNAMGNICFLAGKPREAIKYYDLAIKMNPKYTIAYNNRGNIYARMGRYDEAIKNYNHAIQNDKDFAISYRNRGGVYLKMGSYKKAMDDYSRALKINPNDDVAYNNRGVAHCWLEEPKKAVQDYTNAILVNPKDAQVYKNRGLLYSLLNRHEEAIKDYSSAIKIKRNDPDTYYGRATAYAYYGKWRLAIEDYNRAIVLNPKFAQAYCERGYAWLQLQRHYQAWADKFKAIRLGCQCQME